MSFTDYLIDSALILIVLLQIRESPLTTHGLLRPLVIVGAAVGIYFSTLPTAGNDLVLIGLLTALGATLGTSAGLATKVRLRGDVVTGQAGWTAGILWVAGMGARFAFLVWIDHSGAASLVHFSEAHAITGTAAWTDALLGMAVGEVVSRTTTLFVRRHRAARSGEVRPTSAGRELAAA